MVGCLRTLLIACTCLLLAASVSAQTASTAPADFDSLALTEMARTGVPGMAVTFIHGGTVGETRAYGLADVEDDLPVTQDTPFLIASLSKAVTAWTMLGLAEAGKIDLDAPAQNYLRRWHFPPSGYDAGQITIRRLLSHTAGLSASGYNGFPLNAPLPTLEQFLSGTGGRPVQIVLPPGMRHEYSGGGYEVLQLIVEEVTGVPFAQYVERNVLAPLGLTHSTYTQVPIPTGAATGYDYANAPLPQRVHLDLAAAGLYATAPDYARFLSMLMPGRSGELPGRGLLRQTSIAQMFVPAPVSNESYGLGMYVVPLADGTFSIWHNGRERGYKLLFAAVPPIGEGMVILTNAARGDQMYPGLVCAWTATLPVNAQNLCDAFS